MPDTFLDLFFGYTAFWLLIGLYVLRLGAEQRKLSTKLGELEGLLSVERQAAAQTIARVQS